LTALSQSAPATKISKENMSEPRRARGSAPWVVAGVLVLVVAALVVGLVRTYAVRDDNAHTAGTRNGPTQEQQAAVQAAATEAANLTTFSRKNFASDFARAVSGATGALKADVAKNKASTLAAMTKGKFDLVSNVVQSAFESASGSKVLVLVTLNGTHKFDSGQTPVGSTQRLELTMVRSGDSWLAKDLFKIGIS
jgi:hypothetical protein